MIDKKRFKGGQGVWLTHSLFLEMSNYDTELAVYTLKDDDHEFKGKLYPSLKKLYLEVGDPTEYEFAQQHLGGWDHWKRILNHNTLREDYISKWREELSMRFRSEAVRGMVGAATGERPSFQAIKWLADAGWDMDGGKGSQKRKKAEKKAAVVAIKSEYENDIERMK